MIVIHKFFSVLGVASLSLVGVFSSISVTFNNSGYQASLPLKIVNGSANAGTQQYVPPSGRRRIQRTEGSGARGCSNSIPVRLNLLTPTNHIARTTLSHPTFLWSVSESTDRVMVFTLTAPGSIQPVYQKRMKADKAGIMSLELPQSSPELAVGKEYRWTVTLMCNEKRPSENINARAWIERVEISPNLSQQLTTANSERDRALAYTQLGIWYDGLAILNKLQAANPTDRQVFNSFISLLEQIGLNNVATQERDRQQN
ncbi:MULTISPECIES: DUF928 domain-containing protein [Nostocales]|uniref:DUF928 domain-containing protein n=3 Tax=Nostocales TaxID=1161 RepID=A0A8S9TBW5_9CYAN|nr:DUF928 domain-containing protein [Tolypothrix bouteillei]KAF3888939.1 DUF928 domain-containing protein [Tolypothrix bouteillei VB521301]